MMRVETPKQRNWSQDLFESAIDLHGHGGPFLVIGLRMGLMALELLDAHGWFDLRCLARLRWEPPDSCVIDGIQLSSGCTMGKHNIVVEERSGVAALFTKGERSLEMRLKTGTLERVREVLALKSEEATRSLISALLGSSYKDLFEVSVGP